MDNRLFLKRIHVHGQLYYTLTGILGETKKKQRPSKHTGHVFPIHININADSDPAIHLNGPSHPGLAIIILAVKMLNFLPFIPIFIFFIP